MHDSRSTRVLLVVDAADDVELVGGILTRSGMAIEMAHVASEAALVQALNDRWDVILTDFNLPALDAFGVLRILRERSIDTPCIVVSGAVGEEIATQTMRAGARDYVLKTNLSRLPAVTRREIADAQKRASRRQLEQTHQALRDVVFEAGRFLEPAELATYVLGKARALLAVERSALYWWSEKHGALELLAESNSNLQLVGAPPGADASRLAFQSQQAVVIQDYETWPQRTTESSGSAVAVPAMADHRALGALYAYSPAPRTFGVEETATLRLLASQVAPAIMVRQLLSALRASEQRFETVFRRNPVGIVVSRLSDQVVLDVNESMLDLIGYERDELLGRSAPELGLIRLEQRGGLAVAFEGARSSQGTEVQIQSRQGAFRDVVVYSEAIALDESPAVLSTAVDLTARRSAERMLRHQSLHDELTGLPNRAYLYEHVLAQIGLQPRGFAVLFIDLDDFSAANDSLGHHGADLLLTQVARRLKQCLPEPNLLARSGGDEFAAVLTDGDAGDWLRIARELLASLETPFPVGGSDVLVGASIGLASFPKHASNADDLFKHATVALQAAKPIGWTCVAYDDVRREWDSATPGRLQELHLAIERDELLLLYQPIFEIRSRAVVGVEALLRWQHPQAGFLGPSSFLPGAERTSLMNPLLNWVLRTALLETKAARLPVAVNLSVRNLLETKLPELVAATLREADRASSDLTFEITENGAMSNPETAVRVLSELRAMGCRLSIDDFGTGYSSMAYLQRLPVHELKIDGSFVQGIPADRRNTSIVQASIALAHGLGLEVVGEGVEQEASFGSLATLGCDRAQGYILARPMPASELPVRCAAKDLSDRP